MFADRTHQNEDLVWHVYMSHAVNSLKITNRCLVESNKFLYNTFMNEIVWEWRVIISKMFEVNKLKKEVLMLPLELSESIRTLSTVGKRNVVNVRYLAIANSQ